MLRCVHPPADKLGLEPFAAAKLESAIVKPRAERVMRARQEKADQKSWKRCSHIRRDLQPERGAMAFLGHTDASKDCCATLARLTDDPGNEALHEAESQRLRHVMAVARSLRTPI